MTMAETPARHTCRSWWASLLLTIFLPTLVLADQPAAGQQAGASAGGPPASAPAGQPAGGQQDEAEALRQLILKKIAEANAAKGQQTTQPADSPRPPTPPARPRPLRPTVESAATQPGAETQPKAQTQPAEAAKGCGSGDSSVDLTPPPPDQPQPRWVCESETVDIGDVWRNQPAVFVFKIRNEGEGVLNINIRRA